MNAETFSKTPLDDVCCIYQSKTVETFTLSKDKFDELWFLHPDRYHTVKMFGKNMPTPRWQQAYGKNYRYTGAENNSLPIPDELKLFLHWSQTHIDQRLNGILVNWYDGTKGHYIGAHRDDTRDLCNNSPIVTISLGEERIFRMRPYGKPGYKDFLFSNGQVIVIPYSTNELWTHEVPNFTKYTRKRISVTLRAYL
ncbi:2OG-Fe(II) oxygenase [Sphingobacteriales bacterium UPWRP_1]|nr:2OG-Fe(II) oxygenase [Sphingobacteriales bacterium TSM_CSM]PSJ75727.1 2OG-Fe(II) oxygenase [Sphingobacteriales bacterium UPWRP_1]